MNGRSVVITGRGVFSPLGCDWPSFADAVRAGRQAKPVPFPGAGTGVRCYPLSDPGVAGDRRVEPLSELATAAVRQALLEAGLGAGDSPLDEVGLVMNTVLGPSSAIESYLERLRDRGPRAARPAQFVDTLLSMPASRVGIALKLRGSTAVLGGSSAFELAFDWVRQGRSPLVVAGGAEYLSPKCLRFSEVLADRSGSRRVTWGQAAAFGVLEDADHALRRGARPLAELLGTGSASEPQEVSVPWGCDSSGRAQGAALRGALACASIAWADVGTVCLAAGDDASEEAELTGLRSVLDLPQALLRPKRLMGESLGASAGVGLLATIAALEGTGSIAIVNSFEMGGAVSSMGVRVP